jgi:hypothetical protein
MIARRYSYRWRRASAQSGGRTNAGAGNPDPAPPSVPAYGEVDAETLRAPERQVLWHRIAAPMLAAHSAG